MDIKKNVKTVAKYQIRQACGSRRFQSDPESASESGPDPKNQNKQDFIS